MLADDCLAQMQLFISEMSLAVYNARSGEATLDDAWTAVEKGCDALATLAESQSDDV